MNTSQHPASCHQREASTIVDKTSFMPWILWACAVFFIFYQFVLRTSLGVMAPNLMDRFSLSGPEFSLLGSLFYYGYAGMQIPAGVLLDHFGPRYLLPCFVFLCVLGFCLFSFTSHLEIALLGRFLTGVGSSGAFIGTVKTTHALFEEKSFKNLIGLSVSLGLIGAIYGGLPIGALLDTYGLTPVIQGLSYTGILFFLIVGCLFLNPQLKIYFARTISSKSSEFSGENVSFMDGFKSIFANKPLLGLIMSTGGMSIILYVFADQWGPLYLIQYHSICFETASSAVSFIYTGMMISATGLSLIATRFQSHKLIVGICGLIMPLIVLTTLVMPTLPLWSLAPMMLLFGWCASLQVIFFSLIIDFLPKKFIGMAVGFSNMTIMVFGSAAINLSGALMDFFPLISSDAVEMVSQTPHYARESFQLMLSSSSGIAILSVFGFIASVYYLSKKEKKLRKLTE